MYHKILVPVDLAHADSLSKACGTAARLGKTFEAPVVYVGVTAATPGKVAHNPAEFTEKLAALVKRETDAHGHTGEPKTVVSHDPSIDLEDAILKAIDETGADLVVMASHIPNLADHLWPSHGGTVAARSAASVFVVR
ncbi:MAG: universal stress protein [Paracoccaceae bacterium]